MWKAVETDSSDQHLKFRIRENNSPVSSSKFLKLLEGSELFREFYNDFLASSGFKAFFWENKPMSGGLMTEEYECSLINSGFLAGKSPDINTFQDHFDRSKKVVSFSNLGKDAQLIAPVPKGKVDCYTHIGVFVRYADKHQIDGFWKTVAEETVQHINKNPVWLSTSGLGVFWLHARIDSYPKYYQTAEYKNYNQ